MKRNKNTKLRIKYLDNLIKDFTASRNPPIIIYILEGGERMLEMPTDVQFKHELRKQLKDINRKLEMLRNKEYEKLEKEYLGEIEDILKSLQD